MSATRHDSQNDSLPNIVSYSALVMSWVCRSLNSDFRQRLDTLVSKKVCRHSMRAS